MTIWAKVSRLAAEGEQMIMPTLNEVEAGKPFVQVTAIDKSVE